MLPDKEEEHVIRHDDKKSRLDKPNKKSKTKTTHQIMQEKFGSLSKHQDSETGQKPSKRKSSPSSRSDTGQQESTVNVDHISLQLTDLPTYTGYEEHSFSLQDEHPARSQRDEVLSSVDFTIASKPMSFDHMTMAEQGSSHADANTQRNGETSETQRDVRSRQQYLNTNPRHVNHIKGRSSTRSRHSSKRDISFSETGRSVQQQNGNQQLSESQSISQVIDLSGGIHVPHKPLDQWSSFANEPYYFDQPPYIPYEYVMFNPQTNTPHNQVFFSGQPESAGGFIIQEPAAPQQSSNTNDSKTHDKILSPPKSNSTKKSENGKKGNPKSNSSTHRTTKRKSPKSTKLTTDGRSELENERITELKTVALSAMSNQSSTEPEYTESKSSDNTSLLSEMYKRSPANSYEGYDKNFETESQLTSAFRY